MNGIQEASAILQVLATAGSVIAETAVFIQNAREVDETTNKLLDQVKNLHGTVEIVHATLKGWQENTGDQPLGHEERDALAKIESTLKAMDATIQWLLAKVESLGGGKSEPTWIRKGWTQLKYQLHAPAIETRQRQIETSIASLNLMLNCATWCGRTRTADPDARRTHEALDGIQEMMKTLKALIEKALLPIPSSHSNEEDRIAPEDEPSDILERIACQTSSLAAECLTVAESVCDRISRPGSIPDITRPDSIPDFTTESTDPVGRHERSGGVGSSVDNIQHPRPDNSVDSLPQDRDQPSDPDTEDAKEPDYVLTDHIDNNCRMAQEAIKSRDFDRAEDHIYRAIKNAERRASIYGFPFEDRFRFTEIHAFILTKQKRFADATERYKSLLRTARARKSDEDEGRIRYSLALMHRDKYYLNHLGGQDDALFAAWKTNAVEAFNYAVKFQGSRRRSHQRHMDGDEPWKASPSLNQVAELLCDMYGRWGRPAEVLSYEKYLIRADAPLPNLPQLTAPLLGNQGNPPTPPSSDSQGPIGGRNGSTSSVRSDQQLENLHRIKTAADRGIFANIYSNNYEATAYILESASSSFHIDQINDENLTPLLLAVRDGHMNIVRLLLENDPPPDIKAKDTSGWTVLHYALSGPGRYNMLEILLRHGADVHASTTEGTPLHFAVTHNNTKAAQRLIEQSAALDAEDGAKRTPIMRAALEKKYEMVKLLLDAGAKIDPSQFDSKPDIKKFIESILGVRRPSASSMTSTSRSTSSRLSFSWKRRTSRSP